MYKIIHRTFNEIRRDRTYLWLMALIFVLSISYILYTLFSIHSSDIQLIDHYSGLGDTHFYKEKWYSLYEFSVFGLVVGVANLVMLAKLKLASRRHIGIVLAWVTILILVLAFIYTYQVLRLAYL